MEYVLLLWKSKLMLSKKAGRGETIAHRKTYLIPVLYQKIEFPTTRSWCLCISQTLNTDNDDWKFFSLMFGSIFYLRQAFETLCIFSNNSQASQRFTLFKMDDFFSLVRIILVILNFIKEAAVYCAPISSLLFNLVQLQRTLAWINWNSTLSKETDVILKNLIAVKVGL